MDDLTKATGVRTVLKGGIVVSPRAAVPLDVIIEGERIIALAAPGDRYPPADIVVDVTGQLVFPGFIDPHIHARDPGSTEKEDFAHATLAAAAGGLTTVLDMPNTIPPVISAEILKERISTHAKTARVDFGLWGMALGRANLTEISSMFDLGAAGVKVFLGYGLDRSTGRLVTDPSKAESDDVLSAPSTGELYELFEEVARCGRTIGLHCEDMGLLQLMTKRTDEGHDQLYSQLASGRPEVAESLSVAMIIEIARATGCRAHVVHTSTARSIELIREAQRSGIDVSAETCPQYLTLTADQLDRQEAPIKVFPPVRRRTDQDTLWAGVLDGTIPSVGSDHAPHTIEEKSRPLSEQPPGAIGVETMCRLLLHEMLQAKCTPKRIAWILAEGTALTYGIFPQKGTLRPGTDADITVVDPNASWTIRNEELHSKQCVSPWNGFSGRGLPVRTFLRGKPLLRQGEVIEGVTGRYVQSHTADAENGWLDVSADPLIPNRKGC